MAVSLGDLRRFKATLGKFGQNVARLRRFKATLGDLRRKRLYLGELHVSEYVAVNFLFQLIFGFPLS